MIYITIDIDLYFIDVWVAAASPLCLQNIEDTYVG